MSEIPGNAPHEDERIAIIGMAGRFPDAPDIGQFWQNLRSGVESIHEFSRQELDDLGIPATVYEDPNFVPSGTRLPDFDRFDAGFFGFTPREASVMDPQARIFLETSYSALEHAGYDPFRYAEPIGVFAGSNPNDYWFLLGMGDPTDPAGAWDRLIGNDKDFLATRVSHRLDLRGPAMNVQTACSTSLVTIHLACQSLLNYESSIALAGGVSVNLRQGAGYFYQQGMILSPDGHCRAFDVDASGTVLGQACGVVVLKRLSDALEDGDTIHAVILATALNNDGSNKVSYTAPNEDGQAEVIATAQMLAGVNPDEITYIETHGTGTALGDPVEIAALSRVFRAGTDRTGYCAIGSVKTNIGHTDAAAGVTGVIKTVLALERAEIPPTLHFSAPNPAINLPGSPFFVNSELRPWKTNGGPRRAGVSSFGVGGTNAHAVLEEAPAPGAGEPGRKYQLLCVSAKTESGRERAIGDLATHLEQDESQDLADVAFTLGVGRADHQYRSIVVADDHESAVTALRGHGPAQLHRSGPVSGSTRLVFTFPGVGAQYPTMTRGLYQSESAFRQEVDRCALILEPHLGIDIRDLLFPDADDEARAAEQLQTFTLSQSSLVTVEYSLARLLGSWGIHPDGLLGHSTGQYAAAVLAGIFSLEDALKLIAIRGRLMESTVPGIMLAVKAGADDVRELLSDDVELAVVNSPRSCVISGEEAGISDLEPQLEERGLEYQRLRVNRASHCRLLEPIIDDYARAVSEVERHAPVVPMFSDSNGTLMTAEQAIDPNYWAMHLRRTVLFDGCVDELLEEGGWTFVEVGPGRSLSSFVRQSPLWSPEVRAVTTVRHPNESRSDVAAALEAVGQVWLSGVEPEWDRFYQDQRRRRVPLPTYPFERERFWAPNVQNMLALRTQSETSPVGTEPVSRAPIDDWCHIPSWRRAGLSPPVDTDSWLAFVIDDPLGRSLIGRLAGLGDVVSVAPGPEFERVDDARFVIAPDSDEHYDRLIGILAAEGRLPDAVVHMWSPGAAGTRLAPDTVEQALDLGVNSVIALARALGKQDATRAARLELVTAGAHSVMGHEQIRPDAAALLGPCKVIPLEYANLSCRNVDLPTAPTDDEMELLLAELMRQPDEPVVAIRGPHRWVFDVEPTHIPAPGPDELPLKRGGVYMLIGGLGGVGLSIARYLAENYHAKLVLVGRSGRPDATAAREDEELQRRLDVLQEVEDLAADVAVIKADVLDEGQMRHAVEAVESRFGRIDGLVVTAAVLDNAGAIHTRTRSDSKRVIATKVAGTLVIEKVFADRPPDFILFSSSIATMLYHNRFGEVGYVTANSFVEAYASSDRLPTRVVTVAWDDWLEIGLSVRATRMFAESHDYGDVIIQDPIHSFSPAEGVRLFERVLVGDAPLYYISTTDLRARMSRDESATSPFIRHALASDSVATEPVRPAGADEVAEAVTSVWRDLLGFDDISPSDDFFALGGDSLQVARMSDRLTRAFNVSIPINLVFEAPTVSMLASRIEGLLASHASADSEEDSALVEGTL